MKSKKCSVGVMSHVIDNILAPYITRELERGTDYLLGVFDERVIPKTKENVKKCRKYGGS